MLTPVTRSTSRLAVLTWPFLTITSSRNLFFPEGEGLKTLKPLYGMLEITLETEVTAQALDYF